MENASKALLIAGAILLVIAIIAIAVGIVSSTRGTIGVAENQIDAMEVKMHNNRFTIYEGRVTGADVKDCIATVLSNNTETKNNSMKVYVKVGTLKYGINYNTNGTVKNNDGQTSFSSKDIESNAIYNGVCSINSQGIINEIVFTKQ